MQVVICPGIHPPALTAQFVQAIPLPSAWVYPAPTAPAYSGLQILAFLLERLKQDAAGSSQPCPSQRPLLLIGFSAGVVGAITAADLWQALGGRVLTLIAIDGWGMPLRAAFPIHRFSHDPFSHWSSALFDSGRPETRPVSFYADPPVGHLNFWRAPQTTQGWAVSPQGRHGSHSGSHTSSSAADLVRQIIANYSRPPLI